MNVEAIAAKRQRVLEEAAERSERALKKATEKAENALAELSDAATDFYDDHKDDAEEMLRDAGRTLSQAVGHAAATLVAMLPSERRRRRRRRTALILAGIAAVGVAGYCYQEWMRRQEAVNQATASRPASGPEYRSESG